MPNERAELRRIYADVPEVKCRRLCQRYCGAILVPRVERAQLSRAHGRAIPSPLWDEQLACRMLVDGSCSVYDARPLICRMWGACDDLPCPHGCEVVPRRLTTAESHELIERVLAVSGESRDDLQAEYAAALRSIK